MAFIDQMNPTGSVLALSSIEVDLAPVQPATDRRDLAQPSALCAPPHAEGNR